MSCQGRNSDDHCCYINGERCIFLQENVEKGFRWTCGLRLQLGSWDAVIADPRYEPIKRFLAQFGYDCKTWSDKDHPCECQQ